LLASGSDDGKLIIWKPGGHAALDHIGEEVWSVRKICGCYSDVYDVAWSPDGSTVFCAVLENMTISFDVETGKMKDRLDGHSQRVQGVAVDPLGQYLASVSADRTVRVYSKGKKGNNYRGNFHIHFVVKGDKDKALDAKEKIAEPRLIGEVAYKHFFRRADWSPDGGLLAVPSARQDEQYCTVLLHRADLSRVAAVLPAMSTTVCVRFAPELVPVEGWGGGAHNRFAVATPTAVYVRP
jgi:chromatin assembly factor 1 subunit B